MVIDSLRYWVTSFHVDGFRFDLGVTLGREAHGFDPRSGFFDAIRQDPVLSRVKLISEPWDIGPGGYQLGNHPPGFAEWNDRFRDGIRRYWRGDEGQRSDFAGRLAGSADFFDRRRAGRGPSINFAASHDGFTLADTVSYAERHNEANGEDNQDGHADNYSANWGVEGPSDDPAIVDTRAAPAARAARHRCSWRRARPWCWPATSSAARRRATTTPTARTTRSPGSTGSRPRARTAGISPGSPPGSPTCAAATPCCAAPRFMHGKDELVDGIRDIAWFDVSGELVSNNSWNNPKELRLVLRRAGRNGDGAVSILTAFFDATGEPACFRLPPPGRPARLLLDSAEPDAPERYLSSDDLMIGPRSVAC